jgi:hypothetical protein
LIKTQDGRQRVHVKHSIKHAEVVPIPEEEKQYPMSQIVPVWLLDVHQDVSRKVNFSIKDECHFLFFIQLILCLSIIVARNFR